MPLHLLSKKSWNVYDPKNIERVRRDEAAAAAREQEEERRLDEYDAQRRVALLRGEEPPPVPQPSQEESAPRRERDPFGRPDKKRRRIAGEDDTDRDIRQAREDVAAAENARVAFTSSGDAKKRSSNAPITDHAGHINLFPTAQPSVKDRENAEAEAEKAKKARELEDQNTMRFSNAAGYKQGTDKPWYSTGGAVVAGEDVGRNAWGNEDPLRKHRDANRMSASDPLLIMQRGTAQLRQAKLDRQKWLEEKQRELLALKQAQERQEKREAGCKRRPMPEDDHELEGFSLGPSAVDSHEEERKRKHRHHSSRHHHHHRRRSRSSDREHRSYRSSRHLSRSPDRHHERSHRSSRHRSRSPDRYRERSHHRSHTHRREGGVHGS